MIRIVIYWLLLIALRMLRTQIHFCLRVPGWSQMMKNENNAVVNINILLYFENCGMKPFLLIAGTLRPLGFSYKAACHLKLISQVCCVLD